MAPRIRTEQRGAEKPNDTYRSIGTTPRRAARLDPSRPPPPRPKDHEDQERQDSRAVYIYLIISENRFDLVKTIQAAHFRHEHGRKQPRIKSRFSEGFVEVIF
jgi:hypothetical protein